MKFQSLKLKFGCARSSVAMLIALFLLSVNFSKIQAIRRGFKAKPCQFPYYVSIHNVHNDNVCGGVIFSPGYVLTAAVCVDTEPEGWTHDPIKIVAGTVNLNSESETWIEVPVERVLIPREYQKPTGFNVAEANIAVLKLKKELQLDPNSCIDKVELLHNKSVKYEHAIAAGFGYQYVGPVIDFNNEILDINGYRDGKLYYIHSEISYEYYQMSLVLGRSMHGAESGVCKMDLGGAFVNGSTAFAIVGDRTARCNEEKQMGLNLPTDDIVIDTSYGNSIPHFSAFINKSVEYNIPAYFHIPTFKKKMNRTLPWWKC